MPSFGRGGAGNITAVQNETERVAEDIEAQQPNADHSLQETAEPSQAAEYAHSGRGGFGNYFSPKELAETGRFNDAGRSHILGDGTSAPSETSATGSAPAHAPSGAPQASSGATMRSVGRGGAGNIDFGGSQAKAREESSRLEEEERQRQLKAMVEEGVKDQLAFPQKAKVPGGDPY